MSDQSEEGQVPAPPGLEGGGELPPRPTVRESFRRGLFVRLPTEGETDEGLSGPEQGAPEQPADDNSYPDQARVEQYPEQVADPYPGWRQAADGSWEAVSPEAYTYAEGREPAAPETYPEIDQSADFASVAGGEPLTRQETDTEAASPFTFRQAAAETAGGVGAGTEEAPLAPMLPPPEAVPEVAPIAEVVPEATPWVAPTPELAPEAVLTPEAAPAVTTEVAPVAEVMPEATPWVAPTPELAPEAVLTPEAAPAVTTEVAPVAEVMPEATPWVAPTPELAPEAVLTPEAAPAVTTEVVPVAEVTPEVAAPFAGVATEAAASAEEPPAAEPVPDAVLAAEDPVAATGLYIPGDVELLEGDMPLYGENEKVPPRFAGSGLGEPIFIEFENLPKTLVGLRRLLPKGTRLAYNYDHERAWVRSSADIDLPSFAERVETLAAEGEEASA